MSSEPEFWSFDVKRAYYLLPRWHGEPGDWEAAAEKESERPGLGAEGYARVIMGQRGYYKSVFTDAKGSWPKTRDGMEILRKKYPESQEILNGYAELAGIAQDRPVSRQLLGIIGNRFYPKSWRNQDRFFQFRKWAFEDPPTAAK